MQSTVFPQFTHWIDTQTDKLTDEISDRPEEYPPKLYILTMAMWLSLIMLAF